jgi:hypothetical protein
MRFRWSLWSVVCCSMAAACSNDDRAASTIGAAGGADSAGASGTPGSISAGGAVTADSPGFIADGDCDARSCAELGWACGYRIDDCGNVLDCASEGLDCAANEICSGGIDGPTRCVAGAIDDCELCGAVPDCAGATGPTRLTGRVVTPGRDDADTGNQVGVPNALVYILRTSSASDLPALGAGIPSGTSRCERCEDQELGPVLTGAVTDAAGEFSLEGNIPVGVEFVLAVKVGQFRRAIAHTLPVEAACETTRLPPSLPGNPTRLPRSEDDGLSVNIPRVAISTGRIDAIECVFEKMGLRHDEFANPGTGAAALERIHLYRGGPDTGDPPGQGARIDDATPHDSLLYGDPERLASYDIIVADCEGTDWDGTANFAQRDANGAFIREYVNRGGRLFASHLSFSWLLDNGSLAYDPATALDTGLGPAGAWSTTIDTSDQGTGRVSLGRAQASPRTEDFARWLSVEGVTDADGAFAIVEPRSQNTSLGAASEEFVYRQDGNGRVQQFSFDTPYGAPAEAACGRVAYSGFHVSVGGGDSPFAEAVFPEHCSGDLTDQEKVLLYMLFDVGACVGELPVPTCVPATCDGSRCGVAPDGCGNLLDCGPCGNTPA